MGLAITAPTRGSSRVYGWLNGVDGIEASTPTAARVYNYFLGGEHHFEPDRRLAEQTIAAMPDVAMQARVNRAFVGRAVRFLVAAGVRQFLDLGAGIPAAGAVHEIADRSRVVYVDVDPVAVAHGMQILADQPRGAMIEHDLREPEAILADPALTGVLDLAQPVGVLANAVLHAIPDADDPAGLIARYRAVLAPGSFLVIAHGTTDGNPELAARLTELSRQTSTPVTFRTAAQIAALFDGFDLVEPGLVWAPLWRPDPGDDLPDHPERSGNCVGVARKAVS